MSKINFNNSLKFYKLKLIKKILEQTNQCRQEIYEDVLVGATDSDLIQKKLDMLSQLNDLETLLLQKTQCFRTQDINDVRNFDPWYLFQNILNRNQ